MTVMETYAPGTFCWADLGTPDADAAKRFYTTLFGWSFEDRPMGKGVFYTMFTVAGRPVAALYPQESPEPPHWLSYVSVDNAAETAARARQLGGTVHMDAIDVLDVGRMALIEDPAGAIVAAWEPRRHAGAGVVGEPNTLCWNELASNDTAAAGRFYEALLGWRSETQPVGSMMYTMFNQGPLPAAGMLQNDPARGPMPSSWLVYFAVDDCDASAALGTSLGATLLVPPRDIPGVGRFAVMADPQGAAFAIIRLEGGP